MKLRKAAVILLTITVLAGVSRGQFYGGSQYSGVGLPFFEVELFRTFNLEAATPRIQVFVEMMYDDLTFVKSDTSDGYIAKFELVAAIYDEDDQQITARLMNRDVYVKDYETTNSRIERVFLTKGMDLPAGTYNLKLRITDLISKQTMSRNQEFSVSDLRNEDVAASDLLFLNDFELDESGNIADIVPRVRDNFTRERDYFYIYFDLFARMIPEKVTIRYRLEDNRGNVPIDTTLTQSVNKAVNGIVFKVDKNKLQKNSYKCLVDIESDDSEIERAKTLSFFWVNVPETQQDLTSAIKQMRYIVDEDSIDKYEEAPLEEQQAFFKAFWDSRDPNPTTKVNELMEEYYRRVNYANREYSNFSEGGWLSDRGRILIKFGYPDDIERHPFELDSVPYIIWRYYSLRKIFVFADRSGFGDYRLLPEYMNYEFQP